MRPVFVKYLGNFSGFWLISNHYHLTLVHVIFKSKHEVISISYMANVGLLFGHESRGCALNVFEVFSLCCNPTSIGIPMLKIRQSHDCLIFNMGNPKPGKMVFVLRYGPRCMKAAKACYDLWHVASILNILITAYPTRIISGTSWKYMYTISITWYSLDGSND